MLIKMRARISGTRDGASWPAIGETIDLPDGEAVDLLNAGLAEAEPAEVETADDPAVESAETADASARRRKD